MDQDKCSFQIGLDISEPYQDTIFQRTPKRNLNISVTSLVPGAKSSLRDELDVESTDSLFQKTHPEDIPASSPMTVTRSALKCFKDNLGDDRIDYSGIEEDCQGEEVQSREEILNSIEGTEKAYWGKKFPHARSELSIPSLVMYSISALKRLKDESNGKSWNSIEGMEEAYPSKKFHYSHSELYIPSLVKSTNTALKSVIEKVNEGMGRIAKASYQISMKVPKVEVNANLEISQRASAITHDISKFRKLKEHLSESGMITNTAIGQILPKIIMTGDFDDSMAQGLNITEKMKSNASSKDAFL